MAGGAGAERVSTAQATATRTLVVEDDPHLAAGLAENLRAEGYAVDMAADGRLALTWLRENSCELVVLDVMLPHIDGFTLCRTLRAEGNNTPVLFLTARGDPQDRVLGLEIGADDYIAKPFFLKDLVRSAKKVVDRLQLEKLQNRQVRPGVIQGRLEEMSIMDLMQSLEMGQKSCQLTIRRGDETGELFFSAGQCKDAKLGALEGEAAVFQAVKWPDGQFEIDFNQAPTRETITRTTTGLLMEGLRLIDEDQRDGPSDGQSEDAAVSEN